MKVISTERVPIKMWLNDIEDGALEQAKHLANLPFTFKHVAIMPDSHQGYGMPIGGVLATKGVIIPNAVGVDIGCGMCATKTNIKVEEFSTETLKKIMGTIREIVPVGSNRQKQPQPREFLPVPCEGRNNWSNEMPIVFKEFNNAQTQIGTLGSGNHFIEIQKGSDGYIWIMIHSGSRNLGFTVAHVYNEIAYNLNKKWYSDTYLLNKDDSLAFLPLDSEEGKRYIAEMNYCIEFALANRRLIMDNIKTAFMINCPRSALLNFEPMINIAHNYAKLEHHFGENVMVHRKGATLASVDTIGIIPGSQGTHSYIVKGKGNPESFNSCSHGAGRQLSRGQAMKILNLDDERKKMEGIVHGIRTIKDLDEAPGSYKDINVVMKNQEDLVEILIELTPLGVIKA